MNDLLGGVLIEHLAECGVLCFSFVKILGFDRFTKLLQRGLELRFCGTIACSALEGLAMALFSTLNIWHFTTPEFGLNTIIPVTSGVISCQEFQDLSSALLDLRTHPCSSPPKPAKTGQNRLKPVPNWVAIPSVTSPIRSAGVEPISRKSR